MEEVSQAVKDLLRLAKISYGATIEEATGVSSTLRRAAVLLDSQAKDIAALQSDIEAQIAIAREAAVRAAGLERDAERYRWLKSRTRCFSLDMGGRHRYDPSSAFMRLQGPTLDDAFDAAIAKDKR